MVNVLFLNDAVGKEMIENRIEQLRKSNNNAVILLGDSTKVQRKISFRCFRSTAFKGRPASDRTKVKRGRIRRFHTDGRESETLKILRRYFGESSTRSEETPFESRVQRNQPGFLKRQQEDANPISPPREDNFGGPFPPFFSSPLIILCLLVTKGVSGFFLNPPSSPASG